MENCFFQKRITKTVRTWWITNDPTQRCHPNDAAVQETKNRTELDRLSNLSIAQNHQKKTSFSIPSQALER
jgi:hypothetical protein